MAIIVRPTKTYGTHKYVSEVAAAPGNYAPVLSSEVDKDIDLVVDAWNGGVDSENIKDAAVTSQKIQNLAVTTAKLADGSVTNAKLGSGALTNIPGSAITPGTLPASAIVANSITDAQLTDGAFVISKANFGPAVTTWDLQQATNDTLYGLPVNGGEIVIAETAWTSRGSGTTFWQGIGRATGYISISAASQQGSVTFRVRYGGNPGVADGNVGDVGTIQAGVFGGGTGFLPFNVTLVFWGAFAIGVTRLKLTGQATTPSSLGGVSIQNRRIQVWEPA